MPIIHTQAFLLQTAGIKRSTQSLKQYLKAQKIFIYIQQLQVQADENGTRMTQLEQDLKQIDNSSTFTHAEIKEYIESLRLFYNYPDPKLKDTTKDLAKDSIELMTKHNIPYPVALETIASFVIKTNMIHSIKNSAEKQSTVSDMTSFQYRILNDHDRMEKNGITGYHLFLIEMTDNEENQNSIEEIKQQFTTKASDGLKVAKALCQKYSEHPSKSSPEGLGVYNVHLLEQISPNFLSSIEGKKIPTTFCITKNGKIYIYLVLKKHSVQCTNINDQNNISVFASTQINTLLDAIDNHQFSYADSSN